MPFTVTMPKLSPTMEEGVVAKWHAKEGDFIEAGDLLLEVSTDKATVEHTALDPGYLRKILVAEGKSATVNHSIAVFTETLDENIEGYRPEGGAEDPETNQEAAQEITEEKIKQEKKEPRAASGIAKPSFTPAPPLENYQFAYERKRVQGKTPASPLARRFAEEQGKDLHSVKGSGPGGRVMSRDLEAAPSMGKFRFSPNQIPKTAPGTFEEEEMSPMRKAIGKRLQEAKTFIPHFYTRIEVDAEPLVSLREQLLQGGLKLTYNDLIVKACASTLSVHAEINSGYNSQDDTIIRFQTVDVSIAVSVEGGLITPIIRHADYKTAVEISAETKSLAQKAKSGKLQPQEYQGGSFTVSNMGMFDVVDFQAIINPPQAAILAVGGIREVPVVKNGAIIPGKRVSLILSADHRVIDGAAAAKFLQDFKKILENPAILLA